MWVQRRPRNRSVNQFSKMVKIRLRGVAYFWAGLSLRGDVMALSYLSRRLVLASPVRLE
jgi:hypothetical protein